MRHSHKRIEEARRAPDAGDNRQFLSNAGRKGGRVTAERKEVLSAYDQMIRERKDAEDEAMRQAANEHIVPIDSDDRNQNAA